MRTFSELISLICDKLYNCRVSVKIESRKCMKTEKGSSFINRFSWYHWSLILSIPFIVIVLFAFTSDELIPIIDHWIGGPVLSLRNPNLTAFLLS